MGRLSRLSKMLVPNAEVQQFTNSPRNPKNHKQSILLTKKTIGNKGEERIEKFDIKLMLKDFLYKSMLLLWIHIITKYDEKDIQVLGQTGKFMTQNVRFFDCPSLKAIENQQQ